MGGDYGGTRRGNLEQLTDCVVKVVPPVLSGLSEKKLEFGEGEGHGVLEAVKDVDLLLASEDELDGMAVLLKFQESLAADTAGGGRLDDKLVSRVRSDGYRLDRHTRVFCACSIECGTLTADACKGRILLISTDKHLAVVKL